MAMRLSELLPKLEAILKREGDLPVALYNDEFGNATSIADIRVRDARRLGGPDYDDALDIGDRYVMEDDDDLGKRFVEFVEAK